jgi:hypothetical protein
MDSTKFKIGDKVILVPNNEAGVIKEVISILGNGNNTYLVNFNNRSKAILESDLAKQEKKKKEKKEINVTEPNKTIKDLFNEEISNIIDYLGLTAVLNNKSTRYNAFKLAKYLVTRNITEVRDFKSNNVSEDAIYDALFNGLGDDSVANSKLFGLILSKLGMETKLVALNDENDNYYVCNLVLMGSKYYYFDLTLERVLYKENCDDPELFIFCACGLGKNSYETYFKPLTLLNEEDGAIPLNISAEDVDIEAINKIIEDFDE